MKRSDLTEFSVEEEGLKLRICRSAAGTLTTSTSNSLPPFPAGPENQGSAIRPQSASAADSTSENEDEPGVSYIRSPMVGTFYRSPSPESPSFVESGAKITESTVICIIEAMKIMNEIQAETKGTILEVLADNGQPVEYGQKLFRIKTL